MISLTYHGVLILVFIAIVIFIASFSLGFYYAMYSLTHCPCKILNHLILKIQEHHAKKPIHDYDCVMNNTYEEWK